MLIAWSRGKKRSTEYEDEILSAIFGPIRYMSRAHQVETICCLARAGGIEIERQNELTDCKIGFWRNLAACGRCEPDIVIELKSGGSVEAVLIIEAKWDSPQSAGQLLQQWECARTRYRHVAVYQLYLTKQPHDIVDMLGEQPDSDHSRALKNITWSRICSAIVNMVPPPGFDAWQIDVAKFLASLGHGALVGFTEMAERDEYQFETDMAWHFQPRMFHLTKNMVYYITHLQSLTSPSYRFLKRGYSHDSTAQPR